MIKNEYCGLLCGELMEKLEEILKPIIEHEQYDPEFAPIMVQKLIDRCIEVKSNMKELERMKNLFAIP